MSHEPILPPGIHDVSEAELDNHFLSPFPESTTRLMLIEGLRTYLTVMRSVGITFELWLDGSFTTDKNDPNDIDLVAFASEIELNTLPLERQEIIKVLFDRISIKHNFDLDVHFTISENQDMRSYWRGWYGFDRYESPKGIARLVISS